MRFSRLDVLMLVAGLAWYGGVPRRTAGRRPAEPDRIRRGPHHAGRVHRVPGRRGGLTAQPAAQPDSGTGGTRRPTLAPAA